MILARMINLEWLKPLSALSFTLLLVACSGGGGGGGSAPLSWIPPSERSDGTGLALSEIAGYRVYYGTVKGSYTDSILVENGSADETELSTIPGGKYFAVVTTIDTDGRESIYSKEVEVSL